jgi:excisionase family DNA binding protein
MERQTIDVNEASIYLGISKDLIYSLVRTRDIPHIRVGKRILFRKGTLDCWITQQEEESKKLL